MATQTDHRQHVKQSMLTQLLCVGVRHGWITELRSIMHPAMPLLCSYRSHRGHLLILHCYTAAASVRCRFSEGLSKLG